MKNKSEMTIKEWVTEDVEGAACLILADALWQIYNGTYCIGGCTRVSQATFDFVGGVNPPGTRNIIGPEFRPKWVDEVFDVLEKHQIDLEDQTFKMVKELKNKEE